jgi:hypothetical protein
VHVSRVKLTEEDRKRLALKKKEQASKLSWNDGDGEGVGMRIVVLKGVFHPDDARATYNFYEEVALAVHHSGHSPSLSPPLFLCLCSVSSRYSSLLFLLGHCRSCTRRSKIQ